MILDDIVALAVRLFAVVLAIYALRNGVSLVPFFHEQGWQSSSYFLAAIMVVLLILAVVLWKFPLAVARGLVGFRNRGEAEVVSTNAEQIQVVGFTVLGMYLLFYVVSDVVYWGSILLIGQRNPELLLEVTPEQKGLMAATIIEFIFALFLLLGANRIVDLIKKFRYGGNA